MDGVFWAILLIITGLAAIKSWRMALTVLGIAAVVKALLFVSTLPHGVLAASITGGVLFLYIVLLVCEVPLPWVPRRPDASIVVQPREPFPAPSAPSGKDDRRRAQRLYVWK